MSGLEALSMVCSIMQVISFTNELITTCKDIYEGRATANSQMQENTASIKTLLEKMHQCSGSVQQSTKDEKDLHAIARNCSDAAQELQMEIQLVTQYHRPGNVMKAFVGGIKSFTRGRKIKELSKRFRQCQETLRDPYTGSCMIRSTKANALQFQQQNNFIELSETLQHFISQIAAGHTEMANLINHDGVQTRQQIRQSETHITDSINAIYVDTDVEAKRNRLLQSLKFESMNARRTNIKIANKAMYASFFSSIGLGTEPIPGSETTAGADFVKWLQSEEQTFWIQGKPGAGKSTLVKFLLQHEHTQKALDKWSHNSRIVSHFFWKPGNVLQRNFRGLLCSLNHQLLSGESSLIDQILSEFEFTKENDSIGDWEISHLMNIFDSILTNYNRPLFFIIDGVDEAVDTQEILKFLAASTTLPNTKWRISSRDEKIFQHAFSTCNGFKLNEYTRDDMLNFAWEEIQYTLRSIQGYESVYTEHFLKELQCFLVGKAEGVYLWLVLALESIKRGLRHNDTKDVILSRLRKLPTGLEELFADMWDRLGEDKDIYQREAAHYFNLLIINRTLVEEYNEIYEKGKLPSEWPLTPFQIMLTQDDEIQRNLLNESYELQPSRLEKKCSDLTKSTSIKTAGLLTTQEKSKNFWPDLQIKREYRELGKHATSKIEFIHRTLFDFLTDTEPGKNILAQARADLVYVQLATVVLCQLRIVETTNNNALDSRGVLHYFRWLLNQAQTHDSFSNERVFTTLLPAFETLFEASLIPWDQRPKRYPRPRFDVILLGDPAFQPFIRQRLKSKGASYATRVLREYMFIRDAEFSRHRDSCINMVDFFHDLGADINSIDACFCEPPVDIGQFAGCFAYESALSVFIKGLYGPGLKGFNPPGFWFYEPLEYLVAFLESSPNLGARTSYLLTSYARMLEDSNWDLRLFLYAIAAGHNEYSADYDERFPAAAIIIEVNLKYLERFLARFAPNDANPLITRAQRLAQLEGSKAYIKPRFILTMIPSGHFRHHVHLLACYRFINEDMDVFPTYGNEVQRSDNVEEIHATFSVKGEEIAKYISLCEKVNVSALTTLLHQKLGACLKKF
ncbi:hypothetical protein GGI43DRAFT_122675 [Trichoderma evansii]